MKRIKPMDVFMAVPVIVVVGAFVSLLAHMALTMPTVFFMLLGFYCLVFWTYKSGEYFQKRNRKG